MITIEQAAERLKEAIEKQDNYYTVIVDGNRHNLGRPIMTKKETVTVTKCQQIVGTVQTEFGVEVGEIKIYMTQYDLKSLTPAEYRAVLYGDGTPEQLVNKLAIYKSKENCLQIWEDGLPIYENNNGMICRDREALADCLC